MPSACANAPLPYYPGVAVELEIQFTAETQRRREKHFGFSLRSQNLKEDAAPTAFTVALIWPFSVFSVSCGESILVFLCVSAPLR
jgi:hypothetical protein